MESGFRYVSQAPSVFRVAFAAFAGLVGGLLAAASVIVAMGLVLLVVPSLPAFSVLALGMLGIGLGFVTGGAVARHLAGTRPARGWMGAVFALAFVVVLYLLPQRGWAFMPQHGWVSAVSLEDFVMQGREDLVRRYGIIIRAVAPLVGVALGWLGDVSLMGRCRLRSS